MEEFQTLIPKVWMTKTASPRGGRAGQDPQAHVGSSGMLPFGEEGTAQS